MAYRPIPETAVEIQTGLWLNSYTRVIGGVEYTFRHLYSSDGYCFYDKTYEIYDEEGNLIPEDEIQPNQRLYMQYASVAIGKDINDFVSVPVDPSYEIVSAGNTQVTE